MDIDVNGNKLTGLSKVNIILGKNGCGKSTLLKAVEGGLLTKQDVFGATKYITPERGGALVYEAGIEQQHSNNVNWIPSTRRVNQNAQFRQQTIAQYRALETNILRAVEASVEARNGPDDHPQVFSSILNKINALLDNIEIKRDPDRGPIFKIFRKTDGNPVDASAISSGESELISLAIECLTFAENLIEGKRNVLFLDEPDVHLHPDLQARFIKFLVDLVTEHDFEIIIATHSTSIMGELSGYADARVALMQSGDNELNFESIDEQYQRILPVFGAHPLSNIFNKTPILLLEGEDDVRIWQQVVRSSEGRIKLYPVECGSVDILSDYENKVVKIIQAVYDEPVAYSLRDKDEGDESIDDVPPLIRMKLSCRAAENLILSDEVLASTGIDWAEFQTRADKWLTDNPTHPQYGVFKVFKDEGFDRKQAKLKKLRVLLVALMGNDKPWEVLVGQAIAGQHKDSSPKEDSLQDYLGSKLAETLLPA